MMNRTVCKMLAQVVETDRIAMHDHFSALIAQTFGKIAFVPKATICYRQHEKNNIGAANARSLTYMWKRYRAGKNQFQKEMVRYMSQAAYFYELYHNRIVDEQTRKLIDEWRTCMRKKSFTVYVFI